MAEKPVREVTDAELLGGDDEMDEKQAGAIADLNEDDGDSEALAGTEPDGDKDDDDKLTIIIESDKPKPEPGEEGAVEEDPEPVEAEAGTDDGEPVGDDLTADEKKTYSQKVQDRIRRERRAKQEAIGERDALVQKNREAQIDALESKKVAVALLAENTEGKIAAKSAEVKTAMEGGDSDALIKAQGELDDLRARRRDIETTKVRLDATKIADTPVVPETQKAWLGTNRWFSNAKFGAEAEYARAIDRSLAAEKTLKPFTSEYYEELDRRIAKNIPNLRAKIRQEFGSGTPRQVPGRQRVAAVQRTAPASSAKPGQVSLTRQDIENMRSFGLNTDPNTPEGKQHLREYAQNKRQGARA